MWWNARAFFHHDAKTRFAKSNFLHSISDGYDILVLLETHGNDHDLSRLRHRFKDFRIYNSWGDDSNTGGIVILVRKSALVGAIEPLALLPRLATI